MFPALQTFSQNKHLGLIIKQLTRAVPYRPLMLLQQDSKVRRCHYNPTAGQHDNVGFGGLDAQDVKLKTLLLLSFG